MRQQLEAAVHLVVDRNPALVRRRIVLEEAHPFGHFATLLSDDHRTQLFQERRFVLATNRAPMLQKVDEQNYVSIPDGRLHSSAFSWRLR